MLNMLLKIKQSYKNIKLNAQVKFKRQAEKLEFPVKK